MADGFYRGTVCRLQLSKNTRRWEFPNDRFVEYEKKDEDWCRLLGIGREVGHEETLSWPVGILTTYSFSASPDGGADVRIIYHVPPVKK